MRTIIIIIIRHTHFNKAADVGDVGCGLSN